MGISIGWRRRLAFTSTDWRDCRWQARDHRGHRPATVPILWPLEWLLAPCADCPRHGVGSGRSRKDPREDQALERNQPQDPGSGLKRAMFDRRLPPRQRRTLACRRSLMAVPSSLAVRRRQALRAPENGRESYGMFARNGILFNHGSARARREFRHAKDHAGLRGSRFRLSSGRGGDAVRRCVQGRTNEARLDRRGPVCGSRRPNGARRSANSAVRRARLGTWSRGAQAERCLA